MRKRVQFNHPTLLEDGRVWNIPGESISYQYKYLYVY